MDTCARCHRPIEGGWFIDRTTGVTMHATCFLGGAVARRPAAEVKAFRRPVVASKPKRLAA
jgi:hypothetical protein